jgi:hypothetical protein
MLTGVTNKAAPGGGTILYIGGTLTITSAATEGDFSPAFTINVNYN